MANTARQNTTNGKSKTAGKPAAKTTTKPASKPAATNGRKPATKPADATGRKPAHEYATRVKPADLKPIKRFRPRKLNWDLTKEDAIVEIKSPRTGNTEVFKIQRQGERTKFYPGQRIAWMFTGDDFNNPFHWTCIGTVDEEGIHVFGTKKSESSVPSKWERIAFMLEETERFREKGCKYQVTKI